MRAVSLDGSDLCVSTYLGIGALAHGRISAWAGCSPVRCWAGRGRRRSSDIDAARPDRGERHCVDRQRAQAFPGGPLLPLCARADRRLLLSRVSSDHAVGRMLPPLPQVPRDRRIAFTHGLGCGLLSVCLFATTLGYALPPTCRNCSAPRSAADAAGLSALHARNSRATPVDDRSALIAGTRLYPLAPHADTGVDILISGVSPDRSPMRGPGGGSGHDDFVGDWHALLVLVSRASCPMMSGGCSGSSLGGGVDEGAELRSGRGRWRPRSCRRHRANRGSSPACGPKHILGKMLLASLSPASRPPDLTPPFNRGSTLAGVVCGELAMLAGKWWLG